MLPVIWREESHRMDQGRLLRVALPEGYEHGAARYPVLVCLDAQWTFGTVCDAALSLGLARLLPRVIVVGVGWTASQAREVARHRVETFTPSAAPVPEFVAPGGAALKPGGGAEYLDWLTNDALGLLDERYRTIPDSRTLIGHSLSALFGLYTLLQEPDAFSRWLLASPSSWWDGRMIFGVEQASRQRGVALAGRAFLSVGAEEQAVGPIPMLANTRELAERLSARHTERFVSTLAVLEGEIHHSTIPAAVSRGLRWLYG